MEKTRIRITYAFEDETGFQVPDLMITKEWYDDKNPKNVEFAECLYVEDIQESDIYHDKILLKQSEVNMINTVKRYLKDNKKIMAIKHYREYTNTDLKTAHRFIKSLPEYREG